MRQLEVRLYRFKCTEITSLFPINMCLLIFCTNAFLLLKLYLRTVECCIYGLPLLKSFRCLWKVHECTSVDILVASGSGPLIETSLAASTAGSIRAPLLNSNGAVLFPRYCCTFSRAELNRYTTHSGKRNYAIKQS